MIWLRLLRLVSSVKAQRNALALAFACLGLLYAGGFLRHRQAAKVRAEPYLAHQTSRFAQTQQLAHECDGFRVVEYVPSPSEAKKIAKDYRPAVQADGGKLTVQKPDGTKERIRPLGEVRILPAPWGAYVLPSIGENGELVAPVKPVPEPFTEALHSWRLYGELDRVASGPSTVRSGWGGEAGALYDWRRFGRWHLLAGASASWDTISGVRVTAGLRLSREQFPLGLRKGANE